MHTFEKLGKRKFFAYCRTYVAETSRVDLGTLCKIRSVVGWQTPRAGTAVRLFPPSSIPYIFRVKKPGCDEVLIISL
jgi:hypothetical protein